MSNPFSRTTRSLQADNFTISLLAIGFTVILLLGWGAWIFLAQISLREVSQKVQITNEGVIIAEYAPEALARIKPRQPAQLRPIAESETEPIPAIVTEINEAEQQVLLFASSNAIFDLAPEIVTEVEIEVEQISPVGLIFRASGLFKN